MAAIAAAFYWAMYWAAPDPSLYWLAWLWTLYGLCFSLALWGVRITAIDVGADVLTVRHPIRTQVASMSDVLRVDAHRVPARVLGRHQPPVYRIDVWLTAFRHWRLDNIEPEAGDRLLAALNARRKPVWLFATS